MLRNEKRNPHPDSVGVAHGLAFLLAVCGCGPSIPPRYVLERDLDALSYRRYQRVLDVEIQVEDNPGVGHTATYLAPADGTRVAFVNAFVTVYERAPGLAAEVRAQLETLTSYAVRVVDVEGGRAFFLDGGEGDQWWLWVSANRVVKIGGNADESSLRRAVAAYMALYPSDLDEHGRAREGTASAGSTAARSGTKAGRAADLPASLRTSETEGSGS